MLLLITLFAVLRYNTGWDYAAYYNMIDDPREFVNSVPRFSVLWQLFYSFVFLLGIPHLAIAIPNALTYLVLYVSLLLIYDNNEKRICQSLLVYSLWPFFLLDSFSIMRQSLAISISVLVYALSYRKRNLLALFFVGLAYFVHPSSIISIVFIPYFYYKGELTKKMIFVIALMVIMSLGSVSIFLHWVTIPGVSELAGYMDVTDSYGSKLVFLQLVILCFFWNSWKYLINDNLAKRNCFIIMSTIISEIILYMFGIGSFAARIFKYSEIIMILELINFCKYYKNKGLDKMIVPILFFLFCVYLSLINTEAAVANASSPYVPYVFIWNK